MAEIIHCPSCQRSLQVPESLFGQDVQCPSCSATFTASGTSPSQPAPSSSPPSTDYSPSPPPPPRTEQPRPQPHGGGYQGGYENDERMRRRRHRDLLPHRGGMILAFGIIGLVACIIFAPIAWVMGNQDIAEINSGRMDPEGEGLTQAGRILGIIGTVLLLIYTAVMVLVCFGIFTSAMVAAGK